MRAISLVQFEYTGSNRIGRFKTPVDEINDFNNLKRNAEYKNICPFIYSLFVKIVDMSFSMLRITDDYVLLLTT